MTAERSAGADLELARRATEATPSTELERVLRRFPVGMIVTIASGANAGQMAQVMRVAHVGSVVVKLTRSGWVLAYGPSELR